MTDRNGIPRDTLPVVLPGGIVIVATHVTQYRGKRVWATANGVGWVEPC